MWGEAIVDASNRLNAIEYVQITIQSNVVDLWGLDCGKEWSTHHLMRTEVYY